MPNFTTLAAQLSLENEFRTQLSNPRGLSADDPTESAGRALIGDIAVHGLRSEKLGVVKGVERLEPKLKRFCFLETHVLEKSQVVIVDSWSGEEPAPGGARSAQGVLAEL